MAANGRVAPISAAGNPATTVPKFGKASRSTDSQVVPLKFSPMPSYEIDQLEHAHRPRSKNGVTLAVPIGTVADDSSPVQPRAHFHQPWWKSSIIKLMGSFLVGIVCLSIVAAAVMIRTDSSREQTNGGNSAALPNSLSKRSAVLPPNTTSNEVNDIRTANQQAIIDSHRASEEILNSEVATGWLSNGNRSAPVPIKVVIDPQLVAGASSQPDEQSSNVDTIKHRPVEKSDTRQMRAAIKAEKSQAPFANRFIIEMDIKVRKSN